MSKKEKRLQELRGSDFEIAKGQPDIRGWEVRDRSGHLIGKVDELIFDSRAQKVRYMAVNVVDSKELQLEKRTVLVPIGLAVLQPKDDDVILENVTPFQLRALPRYHKDDLGTKAERAISTVFGRTDGKGGLAQTDDQELDPDFYDHEHFNENNMYRNRSVSNGPASAGVASDAEAASLRRDAELHNASSLHSDTVRDTEAPQQKGETDEEYIRRARKNVDNRDQ